MHDRGAQTRGAMRVKLKALLIAVAALLVLSFLYLGRSGLREREQENPRDSEIFYVAGKCFVQGLSPYNSAHWQDCFIKARQENPALPGRPWYWGESCFAYPPTIAPFVAPVSLLPYEHARRAFALVNLAAWLGIVYLGWKWSSSESQGERLHFLFFAGLAGFSSQALPQTFWHGQMGILVMASTLAAFWCWRTKRTVLGAVFVVLACAKPQVSALPLAYLMLAGGHKIVIAGGIGAAVSSMALFIMLPGSLMSAIDGYFAAYRNFRGYSTYDSLENYFSICGVFGSWKHGHSIMVGGAALGAAVAAVLAWLRRMVPRSGATSEGESSECCCPVADWRFHLFVTLALTVALMPLHPYDLVMINILVLFLPFFRSFTWELAALVPLILAGRAQNLRHLLEETFDLEGGQLTFLPHFLSGVVLLGCLALWIAVASRSRSGRDSQTAQSTPSVKEAALR